MSNFFTGTNSGGNALEVTDGTTMNLDVRKIIVSAGTITASSGHTVTITTGGGGGGTGANPTAEVSGTVVNGVATTFMRSDGAPALANTGVTPADYTSANITVDPQGRITAAASGASGTVTDITVGKDLATGGVNPITASGAIDLEFDAPVVIPGGALLPNGFQNFPPPDVGIPAGQPGSPPSGSLIGGGWVKVNILGVGDAWIPYWIELT